MVTKSTWMKISSTSIGRFGFVATGASISAPLASTVCGSTEIAPVTGSALDASATILLPAAASRPI
jgi:hypothetical protein